MRKVACVNYLNTLPFLHGLDVSNMMEHISLQELVPADCVEAFFDNKADIALIPVGALSDTDMDLICTNFCLGTQAEVGSVALFSQYPLTEIDTVLLDPESRSSNLLVQVLNKHHWMTKMNFVKDESKLIGHAAFVMIGDKAFDAESRYQYVYDLGNAWNEMTQLPFCFAVWVAHKNVDKLFLSEFNRALELGVEQLDLVIATHQDKFPNINLEHYFKNNISYQLTEEKWEAIRLFRTFCKSL